MMLSLIYFFFVFFFFFQAEDGIRDAQESRGLGDVYKRQEEQQHTAPEEQQHTAPEQQQDTAPEEQQDTAPEQQQHTAPEQQQHTAPEEQQHTAPEQQQHTAPEQQQHTAPEEQQHTAPEQQQQEEQCTPELEPAQAINDILSLSASCASEPAWTQQESGVCMPEQSGQTRLPEQRRQSRSVRPPDPRPPPTAGFMSQLFNHTPAYSLQANTRVVHQASSSTNTFSRSLNTGTKAIVNKRQTVSSFTLSQLQSTPEISGNKENASPIKTPNQDSLSTLFKATPRPEIVDPDLGYISKRRSVDDILAEASRLATKERQASTPGR
eukprot:TRINITY_DN6481_c0_g1_i12.p1 TRINITY_DN6481_c0_g1~~TRINITY_DN6481_c0_g1_i12.p1  ORF type:complete len:323 (+),score=93.98 TRINITY_DN6481_c0_g1_i12:95-1063(+)